MRSDIGRPKVDACHDAVMHRFRVDENVAFKPVALHIQSPDDLVPHLSEIDLVLCGFGYHQNNSLRHVVLACGEAGVPCLIFGGSWVGPLTVPGETACYDCLMSQHESMRQMADAVQRPFSGDFGYSVLGGAFAPRISVCVSLAVWEAVRFLSGLDKPPSCNGVIMVDLFHYEHQLFLQVTRNSTCETCRMWKARAPATLMQSHPPVSGLTLVDQESCFDAQ